MRVTVRFGSRARTCGIALAPQLLVLGVEGGDECAAACAVREGVGAVDELVDGAGQWQGAHGWIGDAADQCLGEAFGCRTRNGLSWKGRTRGSTASVSPRSLCRLPTIS